MLPIILMGLASCATPHKVLVLYDHPGSLKPGDRVFWENQFIGSVGDFQANPSGKTVVPLQIRPDFREALTDQSRFLIQSDPDHPGNQSIRMVLLAPGGKPLPDGAVLEGSTTFSYLVEKGSRNIQAFPSLLQDGLDRLVKELGRLSDREWQKELERQIDAWTRELQKSSEETRRYFQREVLPKLEKAIQDFLRRLKELGRELDGKPLEEKLGKLKRTLQSSSLGTRLIQQRIYFPSCQVGSLSPASSGPSFQRKNQAKWDSMPREDSNRQIASLTLQHHPALGNASTS